MLTNDSKKFSPATHRGYIDETGGLTVRPIALEVLAIPMIEPAESGEPLQPRIDRAKELSALGHVIDTQIDIWGWGGENTMRLRRLYGCRDVADPFSGTRIITPEAK